MGSFPRLVRKAIADANLQSALDRNAEQRTHARLQALALLPDSEALRQRAHQIRAAVLDNLEQYRDDFIRQVEANGIQVHQAKDAEAASQSVVDIAQQHGANLVAKSKSMLSEEIELNAALSENGIGVVETDLGEYIIQLREEPPSHIITPAVHLRKEDVAETFAKQLNMPYSPRVEDLVAVARCTLREVFRTVEIGISGVNFGVVENGVLCLVTNEGNGRMVSTLPSVHIALMGIERIVPTMEDLSLMLQLLSRSATGQKLTSYVSLICQLRQEEDFEGPEERHLILVDNGRTAALKTPFMEALYCIRCGACLNACPVFREIGGHAYQSIYPGPIGSVISPVLFGMQAYGHLATASTLCGACRDACPVQIDLPKLLLRVRDEYRTTSRQSPILRWGMSIYSWVMESVGRLHFVQSILGRLSDLLSGRSGWFRILPPPISRWTKRRDFPSFSTKPFRERFDGLTNPGDEILDHQIPEIDRSPPEQKANISDDPIAVFEHEIQALGGEFFHCTSDQTGAIVVQKLQDLNVRNVLIAKNEPFPGGMIRSMQDAGVRLHDANLPHSNPDRSARLAELDPIEAGVTSAVAGIAETGTLIFASGDERSQLASLWPPIHLAVLPVQAIFPSQRRWFEQCAADWMGRSSCLTLISGPSRTADIEMTLTIGVHGPGKLIVVCYS
jgi:L-lactate dehydrogenase complex protein LldF